MHTQKKITCILAGIPAKQEVSFPFTNQLSYFPSPATWFIGAGKGLYSHYEEREICPLTAYTTCTFFNRSFGGFFFPPSKFSRAANIPEHTCAGNSTASCFSGAITRDFLRGVVSLKGMLINWMFRTMALQMRFWSFYIFKHEWGTWVGHLTSGSGQTPKMREGCG